MKDIQGGFFADHHGQGPAEFRSLFRVPFDMFNDIVKTCKDRGLGTSAKCKAPFAAIPLELKVCSALRTLARGPDFLGDARACRCSDDSLRVFFRRFCKMMATYEFKQWIHPPESDSDIEFAEKSYRLAGTPGAIGSVDCVHLHYDRCPAQERSSYDGPKGHPTISYEMVVGHNRRIYSLTPGWPGTTSDKTIVKHDDFVMQMHEGGLYSDKEFLLCHENGRYYRHKGYYLICDGGYHRWRVLQCPVHHSGDPRTARWSKRLTSTRKDVECTFGILKGRFRILKLPLQFHEVEFINQIFATCAVLHNRLLEYDGLHMKVRCRVPL